MPLWSSARGMQQQQRPASAQRERAPNSITLASHAQSPPTSPTEVHSASSRPARGVPDIESDDDAMPTLKQLVQVGTNGAMSSTATPGGHLCGPGGGASWQFGSAQRFDWETQGVPPGCEPAAKGCQEPGFLCVALDVDEVLCQYVDGFRKFMQRERPNGPLDTDSVFHEAHNPNSPWRLQFALCGGLDQLDAVPGAAAALRRLRKAGVRLEAVTSRPPIMRESTEGLLARLFPPGTFSAAHFVGPGQKGHICNYIGAKALVDDQMPNCVDACQCGVVSVLFDFCGSYPWSQHVTELPPRCKRIETWAETCNFLLLALGVDPLEHSTQPSEYLLGMKQVMVGQENITEDYLDGILSEAGKQLTEYDEDDYDRMADFVPGGKVQAPAQEAPRSEPLWQTNDDSNMPGFQSGYGFSSPRTRQAEQDQLRQQDQQRQQLLEQLRPQISTKQGNGGSGGDFRYSGGSAKEEFLNAGSFNQEQQSRQQQPQQQPNWQQAQTTPAVPQAVPQRARTKEEEEDPGNVCVIA